MDSNKLDRLASANSQYGDRFGSPSENPSITNVPISEPYTSSDENKGKTIALSEYFELVKDKRSQGMSQVSNSRKIYDRRIQEYISVAMIANFVIDDKQNISVEKQKLHAKYLVKVQNLFDEFLANIHEKL